MELSEVPEKPQVDHHLTPAEEYRVSMLTAEELAEIDNALISETSASPRKVARIVGFAMVSLENRFNGIPDVFLSRRVRKLIGEGKLIVDGNPEYMRFSEVRRSEN